MSGASGLGSCSRSAALALLLIATPGAYAQVNAGRGPVSLTAEGYVNATTALACEQSFTSSAKDGGLRIDAALRTLLRWSNPSGPDIGVRAVIEGSPEDKFDLAEASLLIFGRGGRLEIGDRQGLPDVLLGYAPPITHGAPPADNPLTFIEQRANRDAAQIYHHHSAPLPAVPLYLRYLRLTL